MSIIDLAKIDFGGQPSGDQKPEVVLNETITENGLKTFNPPAGSVYSQANITVDVPVPTIEANKTQSITSNGQTVIVPTDGNDAMSKVTVDVNVPSSGGTPHNLDLSQGVANTFVATYEIKSITLPSNMDNVTNMNNCFLGCSSLTSISLPELPNVKNMSSCFYYCSSLTSITLPALPAVTNMDSCFNGCTSLTSISLYGLPKVKIMNFCFSRCQSLTSISLPELPAVKDMGSCFNACGALTSITLSGLSLLEDMDNCFSSCSSLTSITLPALPVVTGMRFCFVGCGSLQNLSISSIGDTITTLTNWKLSNTTAITQDSLVNVISALPNNPAKPRTCTFGTTNLGKLTPEQIQVATDKGWTLN